MIEKKEKTKRDNTPDTTISALTEAEEMHSRTIRIPKSPYGEGILYPHSTITFTPGVTVLTGCNGSGKSTLLNILQGQFRKDNTPFYSLDNQKDGGTSAMSESIYFGDSMLAASMAFASEGEQILAVINHTASKLYRFFTYGDNGSSVDRLSAAIEGKNPDEEIKKKMEGNPHGNERWLFFDACDSGLSIDNVIDIKNFFQFLLQENKNFDVYIVVSANEYEMADGMKCLNVSRMAYEEYKTYAEYKKAILKSRKKKEKRLELEE